MEGGGLIECVYSAEEQFETKNKRISELMFHNPSPSYSISRSAPVLLQYGVPVLSLLSFATIAHSAGKCVKLIFHNPSPSY